jgi:hypothetical protein
MPPVVSTREPMRSLRRPLKGLSTAMISGWLRIRRPVADADRPCTITR